jgi:hypothetical protein
VLADQRHYIFQSRVFNPGRGAFSLADDTVANGKTAVCATGRGTTYHGTSVPSCNGRSTSGDCRYARRTVIGFCRSLSSPRGKFLTRGTREREAREDLAACSLRERAPLLPPRGELSSSPPRYISPDVSRLSGYFLAPPCFLRRTIRRAGEYRDCSGRRCRGRAREREREREYRWSDLSVFPFAR